MRTIFAALASLLLFSTIAEASDTVTVPANRTSGVARFFVFNPVNCYNPGQLDYKIMKQPQHGKISVKIDKQVVPKSAKHCAGTLTRSVTVLYTPNRGYHGGDEAVVSVSYPEFYGGYGNKTSQRMKISLKVK